MFSLAKISHLLKYTTGLLLILVINFQSTFAKPGKINGKESCECDWDDNGNWDCLGQGCDEIEDAVGLAVGWIVAIAIVVLILIIGIPICCCFFCGFMCFKSRRKNKKGEVHTVVVPQQQYPQQQYPQQANQQQYPQQANQAPYPAANVQFNNSYGFQQPDQSNGTEQQTSPPYPQ